MSIDTIAKADAALAEVVAAFSRLQEESGEPGVVTDYVLVYAAQRWDDEGQQATAIGYAYPPDGQPFYRTLGLLDQFTASLRRRVARAEDDDE